MTAMKKSARISRWLSLLGAIVLAGCGGSGGSGGGGGNGGAFTSADLPGTWNMTSITAGTQSVSCPGQETVQGFSFSCSANQSVVFNSDGTYTNSIESPTDSGTWKFSVVNEKGVPTMVITFTSTDGDGDYTFTVVNEISKTQLHVTAPQGGGGPLFTFTITKQGL